MAAASNTLSELVPKLTSSLQTASNALPSADSAAPPPSGISLLNVKSEIFLSYLQNLTFLVLLKLKNASKDAENADDLSEEVIKKLVELRVYLQKGVRPLENKLKYQLDKVIRAADSAERSAAAAAAGKSATGASRPGKKSNGVNEAESAEEDSDDAEDSEDSSADSIDDLAYRPNPSAFTNGPTESKAGTLPTKPQSSTEVYRPPRITPTALPTTTGPADDRAGGPRRRKQRSNAIDEYISAEMSGAPLAEPSIGSTIISGGRRDKSAREQREENERTAYEEANFVRLPAPGRKSDKAKGRGGSGDAGFGGEDLRGLGEGLDRIGKLTRKRREGRATEDGPRREGFNAARRGNKRRRI